MKRFIKRIIIASVFAVLLIVYVILTAASASLAESQLSQHTAERWADGTAGYAQVSCYISIDAGYELDSIYTMRSTIDTKLVEASIASESVNPSARLWLDAYSTESKINVSSERGSVAVNVTAVGGDFFLFHPMEYVSGYSFSDDELMNDRVVIDDVLAWQLYGAYDIAGKTITINNKTYYIAGVVKTPADELELTAYGDKPRMYMDYSALKAINSSISICCYEALLPNPISEFGLNLVKDAINADESEIEITENSTRYDTLSLYGRLSTMGVRSMRTNRIVYPYWENVAGVIEDQCALLLLGRTMAVSLGALLALGLLIQFWRTHPASWAKVADYWEKQIEEFRFRKRTKKKKKVKERITE